LLSLVWTEAENSSLFVEMKAAVEGYADVIRALDEVSLDEDESKDLIVRRCVRLQEAGDTDVAMQQESDEPFRRRRQGSPAGHHRPPTSQYSEYESEPSDG
jgi:hypothetical protein